MPYFSNWSLLFRFSKILHAFVISCIHATYSSHFILLDLITQIIFGEECKLWSSSLCIFLQPSVTSCSLDSNIFLTTLFSNTFFLCSSIVRCQVSCPYKVTGKIIKDLRFIQQWRSSLWKQGQQGPPKVGILSHHYTVSQPRILWLESSLPWKSQVSKAKLIFKAMINIIIV